jgi:3-phenylpropionate/trans-cinnamate dioxygenase ferredoxin subunit
VLSTTAPPKSLPTISSDILRPLHSDLLLSDLEPGIPTSISLADGQRVCLVRVGDQVYALEDQCSHQAMPLSAGYVIEPNEGTEDPQIECAWHGARFRCATGEPTRGPALDSVATYEVKVEGGRVTVGVRRRPVG